MRTDSITFAAVTGGTVHGPVTFFSGFSIDSRSVLEGDLFIAIPGPHHDGHDFVGAALQKANGALISRSLSPGSVPEGKSVIRVADTLGAARAWARYVLEALRPKVVAITGSVGKTTTKDLAAGLLSHRYRVGKTTGNLNNTIGLPLEVSRLPEGTEVAVLEMGMSTPGEIRLLSDLVRPDVALVTSVAAAHLGNFASLDEIEAAKGEILSGLGVSGAFVANADDERSLAIGRRHRGTVLRYGLSGHGDLDATARRIEESEGTTRFLLELRGRSAEVALALPGRHNVSNFLGAAAAASLLGLTAEEAAEAAAPLRPARHRGEIKRLEGDILLYDDSYNSSPKALHAAWRAFQAAAGKRRKIVVIGEMLELGRRSPDLHRAAGKELEGRFDLLVAVRGDAAVLAEGTKSAGAPPESVVFVADAEEATSIVRSRLRPGDALFVKGSRGVGLDRLVDALPGCDGRGERP